MKKKISGFAVVSLIITALSLVIYALSFAYPRVADKVNMTVGALIRFILSSVSLPLPFSLFELLIILVPFIAATLIVVAVKRAKSSSDMARGIISFVAVIALILTSYIFTLGVGYHTTPLGQRMDIEDCDNISKDELYHTTLGVISGLNDAYLQINADYGQSTMPYSVDEMCKKLVEAYDTLNDDYSLTVNYRSRVKPVKNSPIMSDLGILGIYSFFTGEANLNVEYPDYYLPFTAAHEMAHQRGISREEEASFVAFLVCISSDDPYIRYSGYLNMYEYLSYDLYLLDRELYDQTYDLLPKTAISDMRAAEEVYRKHKDSPLGKINEKLNDAYLKANGTDGVVSYGYVVRLTVGYYQKQNNG